MWTTVKLPRPHFGFQIQEATYMIISVALLGFGAAGTGLALFRTVLTNRYDQVFPVLMFLCGAAMAAVLAAL